MPFLKPLFFSLSLCLFMVACSGEVKPRTAVGEALGTTYSIQYYSNADLHLKQALDSIFERVNQSMSTYRKTSDISRINDGDTSVEIDTLFQTVFRLSEEVYRDSDGYFDPTVGNLVNAYGFGPEKGLQELDSARIDSLMQYVGFNQLRLVGNRIEKNNPQVYLDFNAIAKGYALDLIGHYLNSKGSENYLIELGGELLAKGKNLQKEHFWSVGIDDPHPQEGERQLTAVIELKDRAMASSGNYRKYRTDPESGEMYVHTINPLTGFAEKSDLLGATVLAKNCALADAYATAFMAMGFERSKKLVENLEGVDAYLIFANEEGEMEEYATPGFSEVMEKL